MQINIQAHNFPLTNSLRGYIKRRLGFTLSARGDHIQRVIVRLTEIDGPRGCVNKHCLIKVALANLPDVEIEGY